VCAGLWLVLAWKMRSGRVSAVAGLT
jgi:hypothetical protein